MYEFIVFDNLRKWLDMDIPTHFVLINLLLLADNIWCFNFVRIYSSIFHILVVKNVFACAIDNLYRVRLIAFLDEASLLWS